MKNIFCTNCGEKTKEGVNFCTSCGTRVSEIIVNNKKQSEASVHTPIKKFHFLRTWIYSTVTIGVIVSIFLGPPGASPTDYIGIAILSALLGVVFTFCVKSDEKNYPLETCGLISSENEARLLETRKMETEALLNFGKSEMIQGLLTFLLSLAVTGIGYLWAEPGGIYFVFWGAMLYGGYSFFRGIYYYILSLRLK